MNIDQYITDLRAGKHLDEYSLTLLMNKMKEVLYQEPTILQLQLPITVCGDIHGQLYDLFELFRISGGPEQNQYVFMGDYVDRGYYSVETFCYLAALKLKYPEKIWLLRGNHECRDVNKAYGLLNQCIQLYGHPGVYNLCNEVFDLLPITAIVGDRIMCVHGGLSPSVTFIEQIALINRNINLPFVGPLADLTWSDPESDNGWQINPRGVGYLFGQKETNKFCQQNQLELICRAHQIAMEGYQYFFGEQQICTVWSAPNYNYRSGNLASVLKIDEKYNRNFVIFKAVPDSERVIPEEVRSEYFA